LYRVEATQRVAQAIKNAGGATPDANLDAINLAAPVSDGEKIVVPRKPAPGMVGVAPTGAPSAAADATVSLSAATVEQLDGLDGIGPTLAARIVDWRERNGGFTSVDQLLDVPGIGQARLDAIRAKLTP
jgi:competence protein ComEA